MSIKYNNKVVAGKYKEQIIPFANTVDAGIAKIATQEQINEGIDNTSIVTPVYLAQKQDKLTAGDGININEANIISSKITPDKVTIIENENNTISTVGRKTVNENIIYDWEGTEAEYHQALTNGEIDPDWYCYITDDEQSVSYSDVLSRTLVNIAPQGEEVIKNLSLENEKLDKSQITNTILDIPQRIKWDLTDGVFTLKAGSKVIVPNGKDSNGNNIFDEVEVAEDMSIGVTSLGSAKRFLAYRNGGFQLIHYSAFAQGTNPSEAIEKFYYHTEENRFYTMGNVVNNFSLPFMCGQYEAQYGFTTIENIFQQFGYFGGCYWRAEIEGLFPDGYNEDGTLNNLQKRITGVRILTISDNIVRPNFDIVLDSNGGFGVGIYLEYDNLPSEKIFKNGYTVNWILNKQDNKVYQWNGTENKYLPKIGLIKLASNVNVNETRFVSMDLCIPFRAVDYNEAKDYLVFDRYDGQWISKSLTLAQLVNVDVTTESTNLEYDLSSYLPNDEYNYEVFVNVDVSSAGVVGAYINAMVVGNGTSNQVSIANRVVNALSVNNYYMAQSGSAIVPIGKNRKLIFRYNVAGAQASINMIQAVGYRRIGINE